MQTKQALRYSLPAAVLITVLIYAYGFQGTFIYDDLNQIVLNTKIKNIFNLQDVIFNGLRQVRVFQNVLVSICWNLSDGQPWSFKLLNLLLHLVNSTILYRLLKKFLPEQPLLSKLSTVFFLIHPLQTQSVTYVMGLTTLLQAFFYFLAIEWYSRFRLTRMPGLCVILFLSLFTKETAVLIPLVLFVFDFLLIRKEKEPIEWKKWALLSLIPILYIPIQTVLQDPSSMYQGVTGFEIYNFFPYVTAQFFYQAFYFILLFTPWNQSLIHSSPPLNAYGIAAGIVGFAVWAWCAWFILTRWKKYPRIVFLMIFYFVSYFPTNSFFQMINPFAEYRLYQTNAVLLTGLAWAVISVADWFRKKGVFHRSLLVLATGFFAFFSIHTFLIVMLWKQRIPVFMQAEELYPNSISVQKELGIAFMLGGDLKTGVLHLLKARKISGKMNPFLLLLFVDVIRKLEYEGRYDEAWTFIQMIENDKTLGELQPKFIEIRESIIRNSLKSGKVPSGVSANSVKIYGEVIPY